MQDETVIQKLKEQLALIPFGYDDINDFEVEFREKGELLDGSIKDIYSISFTTPYFSRMYFAKLDATTLDLYYIMGPGQLIEPKKK
jgi:hypothetical protein